MITHATRSDPGSRHAHTEDRLGADLDLGTFVVADGIGGLADGARTAQIVVDRWPADVARCVPALDGDGDGVARAVGAVTAQLSDQVRRAARCGPGTTGAATALVLVRDGTALAVHLGDSRVYLVRAGRPTRLTRDHARGGQLTRYVGMADAAPAVATTTLLPGDRLLLSTDGLTRGVADEELARTLSGTASIDDACAELVAAARRGGATDDIAVIAVEYGGS